MNAPAPWIRYHAHAAEHRVSLESAHMLSDGAFIRAVTAWGGTISEPTESNPMQSAPYVLFGSYDLTGEYAPDDGAAYVVATYTEGDVSVARYGTAADRDRALWLLERAL
jgi:hypothetical protein